MSEARDEAVRVAIIAILRERGPLPDGEIAAAYRELNADGALPRQSPRALENRVLELIRQGRLRPRWEPTS